jgi:serine/threonine protein kinase
MEKGQTDLTTYIARNALSDQQKLFLCIDILDGIKQLHSINIYHRDIKPDNIYVVNNTWKVGDLGLSDNRNTDFPINEIGNKIGPYGWLSPEAMNKFLCERNNRHKHDCDLTMESDVFQLGKLFWFIFQGNVPIGQISREDFLVNSDELYEIFFSMIAYAKNRRISISEIEQSFNSISKAFDI